MKLQQLRYIWEVAHHDLNVSATAQALFTSSPDQQANSPLEDELGVEVFTQWEASPTSPAGKVILEMAGDSPPRRWHTGCPRVQQ